MRLLLLPLAALIAFPAAAQVRVLPDRPESRDAARDGVEVYFVNEGDAAATLESPDRIRVIAADASEVELSRTDTAIVEVAPGGFAKRRYIPIDAAALADARPAPAPPAGSATPGPAGETVLAGSNGGSAAFLDRIRPYEPIYGVFGAGDAGAKLQLSLAVQPFAGTSVLGGLKLAWTQTIFWAVNEPSGPVRETNYSPEVFFEHRFAPEWTGAIGYRHDSNGRGTIGSIDVNRIYVRLARGFDLGDGWRADIAPQAWFYVGEQGIAPDIERFLGYTALTASIGQADGIKVAGTLRGNPGTGNGAGELFISYPLTRLGGGLGVYAFAQGFTGYGEALSDYNVRSTRGRLGIAFTR